MPAKLPVSAIVMSLNEKLNLEECLKSVSEFIDEIILVDCFSNDNTIEIANKFTNKIYRNKWINYSEQYNWALSNTDIKMNGYFG